MESGQCWCTKQAVDDFRDHFDIPKDHRKGRMLRFYLADGTRALYWIWVKDRTLQVAVVWDSVPQLKCFETMGSIFKKVIHNAEISTWFQDLRFLDTFTQATNCTWIFRIDWTYRPTAGEVY
jgi:hypothetical protein